MPRAPKPPPGAKPVEVLTHDAAKRLNIPTAELQSLAQRSEQGAPVPPVRYPRARPLAPGTERARDADRDPQLIWNGVRISLTPSQRKALAEGQDVTLGDAQLVWRGKDAQDWSDLVVNPPPIYIQEKVHPKQIIADLLRQTAQNAKKASPSGRAPQEPSPSGRDPSKPSPSGRGPQEPSPSGRGQGEGQTPDLFADFNGLPDPEARLDFYQYELHWSNRMILGDSLQVMASLAEREGLRGKVQCIYFDPPYGIKFNSNWQVSTQSPTVKDGKREDVSREPEQVKAFRDTWKDGIHSYLTYLRDRLTVARDLLTESGSIFVQIGDENVHRVRSLMEEIFGPQNFLGQIVFLKTSGAGSPSIGTDTIASTSDYILWFSLNAGKAKFRQPYRPKAVGEAGAEQYRSMRWPDGRREPLGELPLPPEVRAFRYDQFTSQTGTDATRTPIVLEGQKFTVTKGVWKTNAIGASRLIKADRLARVGNTLTYVRYIDDFSAIALNNLWSDTRQSGFGESKVYVVQTALRVVQRCILMATDPGDLVLDPTCGSGTTATVAEQWGRRWITIDTSRVALALARTRLMAAKYPYYLLADSREGRAKEQALTGQIQPDTPTTQDIRHGFVYDRAPHVTLKSIANNAEIDVIWEDAQQTLEPLRATLNAALARTWEEWQIPRDADPAWPDAARQAHAAWWAARIDRQRRIDASIARKADIELLYDRPYEDKSRVRVAGPFTVESLSPHRVLPADEDELLADPAALPDGGAPQTDFATMVLEHLRTAGIQQTEKSGRIVFTSLAFWPGRSIAIDGRYAEGEVERRAGILVGPEFGTLARADLVAAAREASDAGFDVLIACAFAFDAHTADLTRLGPLPILKARMNPDLHMADDLKPGKGNLFVVFGEPDITVRDAGAGLLAVQINGVDVFDPQTGDIRSGGTESIAAWFIDTMYDEESFRVRHAYFLGANDPYKQLKTSLRAEIDEAAWATLYRDVSRPFERPETGRIAVKVINHFGDEVMKVIPV